MYEISIIIPIYNAKELLGQCLDSVTNQDIASKEIICVDDGSEDNSADIVRQYQCKYPYIKLMQQENQGAAVARNRALATAEGKYIAFMDADDYYIDRTGLRKMVEACENNRVSICGSFWTYLRDGKQVSASTYSYRDLFDEKQAVMKCQYADFQYDYRYQSYVFKKALLDEYRITFPNFRRYQDPPFLAEALWRAGEFAVVPVELYCYRVTTCARKFSFLQMIDILKGIKSNLLFAKEKGLEKLFINNRDRLNKDFYYHINHSMEDGNLEIIKLLVEISEIIQGTDFVQEDEDFDIKSLEHLKNVLRRSKVVGNWSYQFPYGEIQYGKRIVLYGAGNVGKAIYSIIDNTDYCKIVIWVDKCNVQYQNDGLPVKPPDMIANEEFDFIIIAVEGQ